MTDITELPEEYKSTGGADDLPFFCMTKIKQVNL